MLEYFLVGVDSDNEPARFVTGDLAMMRDSLLVDFGMHTYIWACRGRMQLSRQLMQCQRYQMAMALQRSSLPPLSTQQFVQGPLLDLQASIQRSRDLDDDDASCSALDIIAASHLDARHEAVTLCDESQLFHIRGAACLRRAASRLDARNVARVGVASGGDGAGCGLCASPFRLLATAYGLHHVIDVVSEDDAFCLALSCRELRDALYARFTINRVNPYVVGATLPACEVWILGFPGNSLCTCARFKTRDAAMMRSVARIEWGRALRDCAWPHHSGSGAIIDETVMPDEYEMQVSLLGRRARAGRVHDIATWDDWKMIATAAGLGEVAAVCWFRAHGYGWNSAAVHAAAGAGQLGMLQFLRGCVVECPELAWGPITTAAAAAGGHLSVLQWLIYQGCPWCCTCAYLAAFFGHLHILKWLESEWGEWSDPAYAHLPCHRRYCPALHGAHNQGVCAAAAVGGHLEVLRWARQPSGKRNRRSLPWNRSFCAAYASPMAQQGRSWFGEDRVGRDGIPTNGEVLAAFDDHHRASELCVWIRAQPDAYPYEVPVAHEHPLTDTALYQYVATVACCVLVCVTCAFPLQIRGSVRQWHVAARAHRW